MSESNREKLSRLRSMARGDATWDLSSNDIAAIRFALEIIDRLPKTADDMPIAQGMCLYLRDDYTKPLIVKVATYPRIGTETGHNYEASELYSTSEAARKARSK